MPVDEWDAAEPRSWKPEWRYAAVSGALQVLQQMSRAVGRVVLALRNPDGLDAWAASIEGHSRQLGFMQPGGYLTLPSVFPSDRGAIAFDRGTNIPSYVDNAGHWQPFGTGSVGVSTVVEGNTLVVAAQNSMDPSRADTAYRCTGTADEGKINAAIDAVGTAGGGTVRLLAGTYSLSQPVVMLRNNVALRGQGWSSVLRRDFDTGTAEHGALEMGGNNATLFGLEITDLKVDGNARGGANNHGLHVQNGVSDGRIERVWVTSSGGNNFRSNAPSQRMRFVGNRSDLAGAFGYVLSWLYSLIEGNQSDQDVGGFWIGNGTTFTLVQGNVARRVRTTYPLHLWGAVASCVRGNFFEADATPPNPFTPGQGVRLEADTECVFDGNACRGASGAGVTVYNSNDLRVTQNFVRGATQSGIWVPGSNRVGISGNHLLKCGAYGVEIRDDSGDVRLGENVYGVGPDANTNGAYLDQTLLTAATPTRVGPGSVIQRNSAVTLTGAEALVLADAGGSGINVTLPSLALTGRTNPLRGWRCTIKKVDAGTSFVTVIGVVDGVNGNQITQPNGVFSIFCDGNAYYFERQASSGASTAEAVGTIKPWPGASAPSGWALCDGSALSRSGFPALFALLGTTYGAGNGTTTFNVPDLRGRVPLGADGGHGLGVAGGSAQHQHGFPTDTFTQPGTAAINDHAGHTHQVDLAGATLEVGVNPNTTLATLNYTPGSTPVQIAAPNHDHLAVSGGNVGGVLNGDAPGTPGILRHTDSGHSHRLDGRLTALNPATLPPHLPFNWIIKTT